MNWRNLQANAFEAMLAAMCIISGLTTFFQPEQLANSVVGRTIHPWDFLWTAMFFLSGILIMIGLSVPNKSVGQGNGHFKIESQGAELAGLIFLGTTLLINAVAAIYINGFTPGLAIYLAVALACVYRSRVILSPAVDFVPVEIVGDTGKPLPKAPASQTDIPPDDFVSREE